MMLDHERAAAALPAYEVGAEIGRGGWGAVFAGQHRQLGRDVAIKQLPRAFAASPDVRARFLAEARVLASLDHPHIVPIYDFVDADGLCLLVMEKLTQGTVWSRFVSRGLTLDQACAVGLATCAGLEHAHRQGVLHRDVKPENLMFSSRGVLKVTDFGIAKMLGGAEHLMTRAGEVLGTPAYMAPEQAQAGELGPATDVYAAGVLLYELFSGHLPYVDDGDALALLYRHVHEDPRPLRAAAPGLPDALAETVMRALARDPGDRYRSAEAFGVALAEAAGAACGPGWVVRSDIPLMASGAILAAAERTSGGMTVGNGRNGPGADDRPRPATGLRDSGRSTPQSDAYRPQTDGQSTGAPDSGRSTAQGDAYRPETVGQEDTVPTSSAPGARAGAAPPTVVDQPVRPDSKSRPTVGDPPFRPAVTTVMRPTVALHASGTVADDLATTDLVPLQEGLRRPPFPWAGLALFAALLIAIAAVVLTDAGSPARGGDLGEGAVTISQEASGGVPPVDVTAGGPVPLDLAEPVVLAATPGIGLTGGRLAVVVMGIEVDSVELVAAPGPDGGTVASADFGGARYLVAGPATVELALPDGRRRVLAVDPAQPALLTVPGALGAGGALFLLAYAESLLRSLRRGRKPVSATVGLTGLGLLAGVAAVDLGWLAGRSPSPAGTATCAVLGGLAGLALARVGTGIGRRRRTGGRRG